MTVFVRAGDLDFALRLFKRETEATQRAVRRHKHYLSRGERQRLKQRLAAQRRLKRERKREQAARRGGAHQRQGRMASPSHAARPGGALLPPAGRWG